MFPDDPDVVFLLFGPPRSGKSSIGNLLLDNENAFSKNKTTRCAVEQATRGGETIRVVDTPPTPIYSDERNRILHDNRETTRSLLLSAPGPRIIIVVVKLEQEPGEVAGCFQFLQTMLGKDAMK